MLLKDLNNEALWPAYDAARIKALRVSLRLTQSELGGILGVDQKTLARWERSVAPTPAAHALFIVETLGNELPALLKTPPRRKGNDTKDADGDEISALEADGIRLLQKRLELNRLEFASLLNLSVGTVDKLMRGAYKPTGALAALLRVLWKSSSKK